MIRHMSISWCGTGAERIFRTLQMRCQGIWRLELRIDQFPATCGMKRPFATCRIHRHGAMNFLRTPNFDKVEVIVTGDCNEVEEVKRLLGGGRVQEEEQDRHEHQHVG